ncbi:unnamed protein product [Zymoseptoria tritici ST99CH_1E4]|uniref:UspA domain-containing protein n=2 Tax=Zymoseptoria tritici TaxID=1047171 RepID=A0A2H1G5R2_ZYMTR|nr:unnamed protein product [Zymoseptoria tritici ST99CH_1E4]
MEESSPTPRSTPALPATDSASASPRSHPLANTQTLPDRSIPDAPLDNAASGTVQSSTTSSTPTFVPPWRRPTINPDENARRPSVQFVPTIKTTGESRSSSAKPPSVRRSLGGSTITTSGTNSKSRRNTGPGGQRFSSPPPPAQFQAKVSFDTFSNPAASDFSLTLNRKHRDYEYTKRSRTFLCGTDTNDYSDTALEWLIDELVDDGDEVVCLRVVEKDSKEATKWSGGQGEKGYRREAQRFLEEIEKKNTDDRAISLVLEFSIGKVQDTIQQMIRIYEPAILVVGTRGKSLTGYQGLLSSGSVSKYCLQYSPVPVIVVRPSSKREAKKRKRMQDPTRNGYRDILDKSEDASRGRGGHLLDANNRFSIVGSDLGALGELDSPGNPDDEARRVAEAIGYRNAAFHPTARGSSLSRMASARSGSSVDGASNDVGRVMKSPQMGAMDSPAASDDDDDYDDEDLRPEDEAAMLAYERAQKIVEEEKEEAIARMKRAERSGSRGAGNRSRAPRASDDEEGGSAVLDLLAKLDRGIK